MITVNKSSSKSKAEAGRAEPIPLLLTRAERFLGTGMQYALSPKSDPGVAVEYAKEDSATQSALVSCGYDVPYMIFMSAHYSWRF